MSANNFYTICVDDSISNTQSIIHHNLKAIPECNEIPDGAAQDQTTHTLLRALTSRPDGATNYLRSNTPET